MNFSNLIFVIDVNVIIHLEKVNLLDELTNDKNAIIVDLVLYQEYQHKPNLISKKISKIKTISLNEMQVAESQNLYMKNRRNSIFDYFSYIAARDNNGILLTGDWKLKKSINKNSDVDVRGAIWYVKYLKEKGIIDENRLLDIYKTWLEDITVYMPNEILEELIKGIERNMVNN